MLQPPINSDSHPHRRSRGGSLLRTLVLLFLLGSALMGVGALYAWNSLPTTQQPSLQRAPREVARHVVQRAEGHSEWVVQVGEWLSGVLLDLDRGTDRLKRVPPPPMDERRGQVTPPEPWQDRGQRQGPGEYQRPGEIPGQRIVTVANSAELLAAIERAAPGDVITLRPGDYPISRTVATRAGGLPGRPIVLRAQPARQARILVRGGYGLEIFHPHWTVEDLVMEGACAHDDDCEHAIHVSGKGAHAVIRRNDLREFSSHLKVNAVDGHHPDDGELAWNRIYNTRLRVTNRATTPVDIVAAARWLVHHNQIFDFGTANPKTTSYGIFAKGGAVDTVIEHNLVICESQLRGHAGSRVGLSFGGGGTGAAYCRGGQRCEQGEHEGGVMRDNTVMACSDAGVYLNRARNAVLERNVLRDTLGIQARFPETLARLSQNHVQGAIRQSHGALLVMEDEGQGVPWWWAYLGLHRASGN